ncbi:hypothetical protein [Nocardioides sp. TF02-7]|uniref:hypothetical protein n=1 Tax=Nocardioides sp. TF02-7 TaxID=2917724 RepID=UPI001F05F6EA|nr:hypothetical protein [Nocardioides sp. TF02-7]UMG93948.1 hypothetical protein MF408_07610 [Nocardioides sp. TF02-7]
MIAFGPRAGAKHVTSYFRATFTQDRVPSAVRLSLLADDGAVVYVNGVEVLRDNMPAGTITGDTRAAGNRSGRAENTFRDFTVDPALLRTGINTVAVEVHQDVPNSSDLGLDLRLEADYPTP